MSRKSGHRKPRIKTHSTRTQRGQTEDLKAVDEVVDLIEQCAELDCARKKSEEKHAAIKKKYVNYRLQAAHREWRHKHQIVVLYISSTLGWALVILLMLLHRG